MATQFSPHTCEQGLNPRTLVSTRDFTNWISWHPPITKQDAREVYKILIIFIYIIDHNWLLYIVL